MFFVFVVVLNLKFSTGLHVLIKCNLKLHEINLHKNHNKKNPHTTKGRSEINKGCTVRFNEVVKFYPQIKLFQRDIAFNVMYFCSNDPMKA